MKFWNTFLVIISLLEIVSSATFAEFVAYCPVSHIQPDDPIVFPGIPGASHMHSFYGSNITNAYTSDTCSFLNKPTTCDPTTDTSSYWIPTLYDPNGAIVRVKKGTFYYQNRNIDNLASIQRLPFGLRMIAGNAKATAPETPRRVTWSCQGEGKASGDMVQCAAGNPNLEILINFPECWNGVDLDSANHKSHVAYATGGACPSTHPVPLVALEFKILYDAIGGPGYTISSGPGYTMHGDVWVAWNEPALELRMINCIRQGKKCGANGIPSDGSTPIITTPPVLPNPCLNVATSQTTQTTQPSSSSSTQLSSSSYSSTQTLSPTVASSTTIPSTTIGTTTSTSICQDCIFDAGKPQVVGLLDDLSFSLQQAEQTLQDLLSLVCTSNSATSS